MAKARWDALNKELGQPDGPSMNALEGVAHGELDSSPGEDPSPNVKTRAHPDIAEPEVLKDAEEDGTAGKTVSAEGDMEPCVRLREPGVSYLATQEDAGSLTLSTPIPPTTLEAASTQRSSAVNTAMATSPEPERGHGTDLELPPHVTLLPPNEAAEHPIHQPPKQIQALTEVEGPLPGEESQRAMSQRGLTLAHALESNMPIGEAHGHPPDFANPQRQGSVVWEPAFIVPKARVRVHKARRPVLDEGAYTHPDLWPNLGIVNVNLDTCSGSASQLEGEKSICIPCVGSELHAGLPAPQNFEPTFSRSPPPLDTLARENSPHGEGAATKWCAIEEHPCPEPSKPSKPPDKNLQEARGVPPVPGDSPAFPEDIDPFGLAGVVENVGAKKVEPSCVDARERGGGGVASRGHCNSPGRRNRQRRTR